MAVWFQAMTWNIRPVQFCQLVTRSLAFIRELTGSRPRKY